MLRRRTCLLAGVSGTAWFVAGLVTAEARVWHVAPDGSGDAPTVQAGLDSARAGDVVLLAQGTYTWTFEAASGGSMLHAGPGVTLRGESGAGATVLDAESRGRILQARDAGDLVVQGLTFRNGVAPEVRADSLTELDAAASPNDARGGAILVTGDSHLTLIGCVLRQNRAASGLAQGGAVYCDRATIEDCEFTDNAAGEGDHTNGRGGAVFGGAVHLLRCRFADNRAHGYEAASGGAVHSQSVTARDCVFEDNRTSCPGAPAGGAIWDGGKAALESCTFRRNRAEAHYFHANGGAVSLQLGTVRDCLFLGNVAVCDRDFGRGGAILGAALHVEGSVFLANEAYGNRPYGPGYGGALYLRFPSVVLQCTFVASSGGAADGVGVLVLDEGGLVERCIVAGTVAGAVCAGSPTWSCNVVFENGGGDAVCGSDGGGNRDVDPLFCARDPVQAADVTLRADSPCAGPDGCGRIGAAGVACEAQAVQRSSWSAVKRLFASPSR